MIDIGLIRDKYHKVKESYERRKDPELLQRLAQVKEYDEEWRKAQYKLDQLKGQKNQLSQSINKTKKEGKDIKPILEEVESLKKEVEQAEMVCEDMRLRAQNGLKHLPNLLHESVPYGVDDTENEELRVWGNAEKKQWVKPNGVFLDEAGLADFDRATKISGAGFYFLRGDLVRLHQALINFALNHLCDKGYEAIEPPVLMRRDAYEGVTDVLDFENVMYKSEGEDEYWIATSEHPLVAMHKDEVIDDEKLPVKYVGVSPCFRREIGAHGLEERGLFRRHQFWKVEQVVLCSPEKSEQMHEELVANCEELLQMLELPYRVVNICTGDIGTVAAKKYDIDVWLPSVGEYKEIASGSNCTDYQARRLNIRYGDQGGKKALLHTLNCTALPTSSRALVAIVENYQQPDGTLKIPKVLQPYMGGQKLIKQRQKA